MNMALLGLPPLCLPVHLGLPLSTLHKHKRQPLRKQILGLLCQTGIVFRLRTT